jgi:secreted PhoX family phosphatase
MVGSSVVFDSSDGGDAELGQIWKYTPLTNIGDRDEEGELELLFESTDRSVLDGPDNLCTSPNNRVVIAEDGKENRSFVRGLRNDGTIVNVARNLVPMRLSIIDASGKLYDPYVPDDDFTIADGLGYSEFAGPRFSPDGTWLFVNIQVPGITCAITGDWASLGL